MGWFENKRIVSCRILFSPDLNLSNKCSAQTFFPTFKCISIGGRKNRMGLVRGSISHYLSLIYVEIDIDRVVVFSFLD